MSSVPSDFEDMLQQSYLPCRRGGLENGTIENKS